MNNSDFEKTIRYRFRDPELLSEALTHSSCGREKPKGVRFDNERLEFIGDAFLDAIIGAELYRRMPEANEGELSKTRAQIVCERTLAMLGRRINIGEHMELGRGEEQVGARNRDSLTADAVEAVIGAVFIDGGTGPVTSFVESLFSDAIDEAIRGRLFTDYKTGLQEIVHKKKKGAKLNYVVMREEGPDHDKTFYVNVILNGTTLGTGSGKNKKEAEQSAARAALEEGIKNVL